MFVKLSFAPGERSVNLAKYFCVCDPPPLCLIALHVSGSQSQLTEHLKALFFNHGRNVSFKHHYLNLCQIVLQSVLIQALRSTGYYQVYQKEKKERK